MSTQDVAGGFPTGPSGTFVGPDDNPDLYELVRHIGVGGEAQVWRAKTRPDPSSPAAITVAVKIFNLQDSPAAQTEWLRRTQALGHVRNPGLAQTLAVFVGAPMHATGERPDPRIPRQRYMVMEFVDGLSLQEWVEDNPTAGLRERFNLLSPVAAALDTLHAGTDTVPPIAHGDVKPDNARLTADGGVKLVDFGLMRMQGTARGGPAMASVPYTAPEIFAAGADAMPTVETDRFSFAATAFHVLTGQAPPLRDDGRGPDPSAMRPILESCPLTAGRPEIGHAVIAALAADPRDRPTSLTRWLGGARATSSVPVTTRQAAPAAGLPRPVGPDDPTSSYPTAAYPTAAYPTAYPTAAYPTPPPSAAQYPVPPVQPTLPPARRRRPLLVGVVVAALVLALGGGAYALVFGKDSPGSTSGATNSPAPTAGATGRTDPPSPTASTSTTDSATTDTSTGTGTTSGAAAATDASGSSGPSTPDTTATERGTPVITGDLSGALLLAGDDAANQGVIALNGGVDRRTQIQLNGRAFDTAFVDPCWGTTCQPRTIDLNLGRSFSRFTGRLGVTDNSEVGRSATIKIFGDGKLLVTRTVALGVSYDVTASVKDVLRLQITFGSYKGRLAPAVGDPTVTP